ncbi:nitrilase-related carbon-nitrogen hydrolase [Frigidibacter sp. MR17.24]|uniref:nitrilase-related carbon-nitrogen hydrolase n=1 Tax=Frigidibacter sp. MR17.24 TaxID=3127345 RepID=UPI003012E35B
MPLTLTLAQIAPPPEDPAATLARIEALARAAAAAGSALLLLPELVLPGYNRPDLHAATTLGDGDGAGPGRIAAIARAAGVAICWGWAERDAEGRLWNAASVVGADGARLGHYRKIQLFGPMERASFQPGLVLSEPFGLGGLRCGLLICYDIEFPEHARALAARGCELLLVPTANPAGFPHVPDLLVPARACENAVSVAYANYAGTDRGLAFDGGSVICGPDGQVLARAGRGPALLTVTLPAPAPGGGLSTQAADLVRGIS